MPRLTYIANIRMPTEKAHGVQIVRMCEAFTRQGLHTTLVHPRRRQPASLLGIDPLDHYAARPRFAIEPIANLDVVRTERWLPAPAYLAAHYTHARLWAQFAVHRAARSWPAELFMTRDIPVAATLVGRGLPAVLEIHQAPERWSLRLLRRIAPRPSMRLIVTMTEALLDRLASRGVDLSRSLVLHDGVDLDRYAVAPEETPWRDGRPTVLYTGHLFPEKGVVTLVDAARELPEVAVRIVGGMPADVAEWRSRLAAEGPSNVEFLGYYPPERIPAIQRAADLLVLPNSGRHPHSARDTSPMKLFEYMAAGRPIVSSDVPALREVLTHDINAWLVPPDEPSALARGIRTLVRDATLASRLSGRARLDVRRYSWAGRAEAIIHGAGLWTSAGTEDDPC